MMRTALVLAALVALVAAVDLRPAVGQGDGAAEPAERALSRSLARAVEAGARHVVAIRPAADAARLRARSGVVVGPELVATCATNVDAFGVDALVVEDGRGRLLPAELRGRDLRLRVVLLRVPGLEAAPPVVARGERAPGTFVLALGGVLGGPAAPTATQGIVSVTGRFEGRAEQVDAPLDASNLGGPLVDLDGRLIGVLVHVDPRLGERSGVGFAVPVPRIEAVLERLVNGDQLEAGWLGVVVPRQDDGAGPGVPVRAVVPGSAAGAAGLEVGDRIVAVGGRAIAGRRAFREAVADLYAGQRVALSVLRGEARVDLDLVLAPRR